MQHGNISLGKAAQKGHSETVQTLLQAGAPVNYKNKVNSNFRESLAVGREYYDTDKV